MSSRLPLPKYHQVYLVLRQRLEDGGYAQGLPGELALTKEFGVARVTMRRALQQLTDEAWIARAPGRRPEVLRRQSEAAPADGGGRAHLSGLLENIVTMGLRTRVTVLECEVLPAGEAVARQLSIEPGTPVQRAVRVRSTRSGPLSHITTHVPAALTQGFGRRELAHKPILVLLEAAGVTIGRATQTLTAKLADAAVARHLDVAVGSPLLAVSRLIRDTADRPVQWLQGLYRPDRYHYEMQLSRVGGIDAKVWVGTELSAPYR